ncbi:CopG family ribbon-helix-helix protein [Halomicrobium mukohataei]
MPPELREEVDETCQSHGYRDRSEFISEALESFREEKQPEVEAAPV